MKEGAAGVLREIRRGLTAFFQFLGPLLNSLLVLLGLWVFLRFGFPRLGALRPGPDDEVFPVPNLLIGLYLGVAALVLAAWIFAEAERRAAVMRPVRAVLEGDPTHPAGVPLVRWATLILVPVLCGWALHSEATLSLPAQRLESLAETTAEVSQEFAKSGREPLELPIYRRGHGFSPISRVRLQVACGPRALAVRTIWKDQEPARGDRCRLYWRVRGERVSRGAAAWSWSHNEGVALLQSGTIAEGVSVRPPEVAEGVTGQGRELVWRTRLEDLLALAGRPDSMREEPTLELRVEIDERDGRAVDGYRSPLLAVRLDGLQPQISRRGELVALLVFLVELLLVTGMPMSRGDRIVTRRLSDSLDPTP